MANGDTTTFSITSIVGLIAGIALMGLGAYRLLTFGGGITRAAPPTSIVVLQYSGAVLIFLGGLILVGIVYRALRKSFLK